MFKISIPRSFIYLFHQKRTQAFWEHDLQVNGDDFFKENLRMHRTTFDVLCGLLPHLAKEDSALRKSIPLQKRIAIALYALGSSAEYRTIANLFGVGKSTVCEIVLEFCTVVWNVMQPNYLNYFPLSREIVQECVSGFETMGFPQCLGAIDMYAV